MPSRYVHPLSEMVTVRSSNGHLTNMTAFVGTDGYPERVAVLRSLDPDLDTTEADTVHQRLCAAQERYDKAFMEWQLGCVGRGPVVPHPGSLKDWMD